jgi:SAM domain (Sterile alpha motif)
MELGRWLRSLGLERYEVTFRENAIDADVLRDLTDQDLEKIGVLLGDRRRLFRAIAELDEAPSSATSPAPASSPGKSTSVSAAATSPTSAAVEVSGDRPNVVTMRANQTPLLKADVANEGLALENAIRQVVTETGKSRTESRAEPRARPPSATPPAGPARPDRANAPPTNLPGEGWHDALLSARQRLLKGRSAAKGQAATSLRHDVVYEGHDLDATTVKAPQAAPPPHDTYEPGAHAATEKVPQAARPPGDTFEPEKGTATAKALQAARPPRDTYEREAGAVTAKAPRPARPQRDSHQPAVPAATAKGPQPARVARDSYEPTARTTSTKAPQPARLPRDPYEPEPRAAPAKTPRAARPPRDSYQPEAGAASIKPPRVARVPRDSYESEELRYPSVIEAEPTFPDIELDLAQEDFESADYDTQRERDLAPAYQLDDDQPVAAPPARHAPRRTAPKEKHQKKRSSLSFGVWARLLAVLLILAGITATISWQWSTIADLYRFLGRIGQQLQDQVSGDNPSAKPEFWPRVAPEPASGQTPGAAAPGGQTAPAVASLIEADPSDPKGKRYVGSVVWRTETVSAGPGVAPELAVRADIEIPERRMTMSWSIRRNTDKTLPASHTIEMTFNLPADFSGGRIANVAAVVMKQSEEERGYKLVTRVAKVTNGFFLIGLSGVDADAQRDTQLIKDRPWFDIGIVYTNGNYAILAMEKGEAGNRAFAQAFASWEKK